MLSLTSFPVFISQKGVVLILKDCSMNLTEWRMNTDSGILELSCTIGIIGHQIIPVLQLHRRIPEFNNNSCSAAAPQDFRVQQSGVTCKLALIITISNDASDFFSVSGNKVDD